MDRRISNGALYGLMISLSLGLFFANYKHLTLEDGVEMKEYLPVYEYVISVLRYGAMGTLIGMFIGWRMSKAKYEGPKTYYGEVFLGVIFLTLGMTALSYLLGG